MASPTEHLIGYARVSTSDQNPDLQLDALKAAGCRRVFIDQASGSTRKKRPELEAMLQFLAPGDTVVVWKLDRLARSLRDLIEIVKELEDREVQFKTIDGDIDTTTSGGKLVFHIFGALAEFERELIRDRTRAGLEAARARGRIGGRTRTFSEDQVEAARAMFKNGKSVQAIANGFGVSRGTIYNYIGDDIQAARDKEKAA